MILVLSPAKSLDYESPPRIETHTLPGFIERSAALVDILRALSPAQIGTLMRISDPLAALNVHRYADWSAEFTTSNSKQAVLAFNGDVYDGLDANSLSADDLRFAQRHLRILSGLYGVLRPLDWMQPYRLEMGTRLANPRGKDLYAFWGDDITLALNADFGSDDDPALVNLASEEYFKAVRPKALKARIVTPVFEDWKSGRYRVVSFYAKRARGLMARYAIEHRITDPRQLKAFNEQGYALADSASDDARWVFRRKVV